MKRFQHLGQEVNIDQKIFLEADDDSWGNATKNTERTCFASSLITLGLGYVTWLHLALDETAKWRVPKNSEKQGELWQEQRSEGDGERRMIIDGETSGARVDWR
ncbi:unnamed protein product [Ilex paraguariensis]|uniref:Uncharacterized protein n=1 Tax=Ilex paraguariensis TaxID=185542 RepID=A0ABC8U7M6_9AQUA